jgi:hypothetical protein
VLRVEVPNKNMKKLKKEEEMVSALAEPLREKKMITIKREMIILYLLFHFLVYSHHVPSTPLIATYI